MTVTSERLCSSTHDVNKFTSFAYYVFHKTLSANDVNEFTPFAYAIRQYDELRGIFSHTRMTSDVILLVF